MKKRMTLTLVLAILFCLTGCKSSDYKTAIGLLEAGDAEQAKSIFTELSDYKDAKSYLQECDYQIACIAQESDKVSDAVELFKKLGDYKDSAERLNIIYDEVYDNAIAKFDSGDWEDALSLFKSIGNYQDSKTYIEFLRDPEKAVKELCVKKTQQVCKSVASYMNYSNSPTSLSDPEYSVKYDAKANKFVCAVRIRISIAQLPTINYNEGFVGHFDGTTPVIDENDTIEDKEIQKFWKENWG